MLAARSSNSALNTTSDLAEWVRQELRAATPEIDHIIRVLTREVARWFRSDNIDIQSLDGTPGSTGSHRWDAMIEALVAYQCHIHHLGAPSWTRKTRIEEGWFPRDSLIKNQGDYVLTIFETPVEFLDKGIVFSFTEMELG
jgi:hypothetical protein